MAGIPIREALLLITPGEMCDVLHARAEIKGGDGHSKT